MSPILTFADDITFFTRALRKSFNNIKEILAEFSSFFGLQVNMSKSQVIFSKKVNDGE